MNATSTITTGTLISVILIGTMLIGWVMNIYKLSECDFKAPYKCEAMHFIGLIPPVGAFTGWMDFDK